MSKVMQRRVGFVHPHTQQLAWGVIDDQSELGVRCCGTGYYLIEDAITPAQWKVNLSAIHTVAAEIAKRQAWIPYLDEHQLIGKDAYSQFVYKKMLEAHNAELCLPKDGKLHIGHQFSVPLNDGTANYIVTHIRNGLCTIEWRGWDPARYIDNEFGWGGKFATTAIKQMVKPDKVDPKAQWGDYAENILKLLTTYIYPVDNKTLHKKKTAEILVLANRLFSCYAADVRMTLQSLGWVLSKAGFACVNTAEIVADKVREETGVRLNVRCGDVKLNIDVLAMPGAKSDDITKVVIKGENPSTPRRETIPPPKKGDKAPLPKNVTTWDEAARLLLNKMRPQVFFRYLDDPHEICGNVLDLKWDECSVVSYVDATQLEVQKLLEAVADECGCEKEQCYFKTKGGQMRIILKSPGEKGTWRYKFTLAAEWVETQNHVTVLIIRSLSKKDREQTVPTPLAEAPMNERWAFCAEQILKQIAKIVDCRDVITYKSIGNQLSIGWANGHAQVAYDDISAYELNRVLVKTVEAAGYKIMTSRMYSVGRTIIMTHPSEGPHWRLYADIFDPKAGITNMSIRLENDADRKVHTLDIEVMELASPEDSLCKVCIKSDASQLKKPKTETPAWRFDARKVLVLLHQRLGSSIKVAEENGKYTRSEKVDFNESQSAIFAFYATRPSVIYDSLWEIMSNLKGSLINALRPSSDNKTGTVGMIVFGQGLEFEFTRLKDTGVDYAITRVRVEPRDFSRPKPKPNAGPAKGKTFPPIPMACPHCKGKSSTEAICDLCKGSGVDCTDIDYSATHRLCIACSGDGVSSQGAPCIPCKGMGMKRITGFCVVCGGSGELGPRVLCTDCNGSGYKTPSPKEDKPKKKKKRTPGAKGVRGGAKKPKPTKKAAPPTCDVCPDGGYVTFCSTDHVWMCLRCKKVFGPLHPISMACPHCKDKSGSTGAVCDACKGSGINCTNIDYSATHRLCAACSGNAVDSQGVPCISCKGRGVKKGRLAKKPGAKGAKRPNPAKKLFDSEEVGIDNGSGTEN